MGAKLSEVYAGASEPIGGCTCTTKNVMDGQCNDRPMAPFPVTEYHVSAGTIMLVDDEDDEVCKQLAQSYDITKLNQQPLRNRKLLKRRSVHSLIPDGIIFPYIIVTVINSMFTKLINYIHLITDRNSLVDSRNKLL